MKLLLLVPILFCFACNSEDITPPGPIYPVPNESQLEWQEKELFAFVHFTINTFTDKEWGYGDEDPNLFNPVDFDPEQWAKYLSDAGFKGLILTCKHHDGFCLWPSEFSDHSVKNSSWRNGQGDVVKEVADACKKYNLEFGVYLSPWDRNRSDYGALSYIDYYQNQLKELFELYGPVFEIWFDGANGGDGYYGGANEKRKIDDQVYYKWEETFKIVRDFSSKTIIRGDARTASDSRWCGNEKGFAGETNWNMISPDTLKALGKTKDRFISLNTGSEHGTMWMPAEVDVSIRPGWFYHSSQDSLVKTPDELFEIYLKSIGRGSPLLLNVAPNKRGLIPDTDIQSLVGWKKKLDETFSNNLALNAKVSVDSYRGKSEKYAASSLNDADEKTYWATNDEINSGSVEFEFEDSQKVKYVLIQEYISLGQGVKSFNIEAFTNGGWEQIAKGTTIGFKKIVNCNSVFTGKIRINITDSRACPVISNIEIY